MKNRKIAISIAIIGIILVSFLSLTSTTDATPNQLDEIRAGEKGHKLVVDLPETMTITEMDWSYVIHGYSYLEADKKDYKTFEFHLYIDDVEVNLKTTKEKGWNDEGEEVESIYSYTTFDAYHFAPDIYNWTITATLNDETIWFVQNPLTVLAEGHRLVVYSPGTMIIAECDRSYVKHGWVELDEATYDDLKPFNVQVFINGEEIDLYYIKENVETETEELYNLWFYQTFDAYYFDPGVYEWYVVWTDATGIIMEFSCPLTVLSDGQQIIVYKPETMAITTTQPCYFSHGWELTEPFDLLTVDSLDVQLFIDGMEIELENNFIIEYTEEGLKYYWQKFNHFESGYFAPGIYNWHVVWSIDSTVVGGFEHPFTVMEDAHQINVFNPESMGITTFQRSYFKHGYSFNGIDEVLQHLPFNTQLFVDDVEEELDMYLEIDYSTEIPTYTYYFYKNFNPYYFDIDLYWWKVIWTDPINVYYEKTFPLTVTDIGLSLNFFFEYPTEYTITVGQRCFIRHGWAADEFGIGLDPMDSAIGTELFIDGVQIHLDRSYHYDPANEYTYIWWHYINFEPYYFAPGTYTLAVHWFNSTYDFWRTKTTLYVIPDGHQIKPTNNLLSLTFTTDQRTFFLYSLQTTDDLDLDLPVTIRFIVEHVEVELEQSYYVFYSSEVEVYYYRWRFYGSFEPYYFAPGDYFIEIIIESLSQQWYYDYTMHVLP
ncbi:MAG: hypothetical protein ACTSSK_13785 [Candidatus Heimdallarchaeota archaeon]